MSRQDLENENIVRSFKYAKQKKVYFLKSKSTVAATAKIMFDIFIIFFRKCLESMHNRMINKMILHY